MKTIDVIIPCYNEESNIAQLITEITEYTSDLNYQFRLTFVDDGSTDNTYEEICSLSKEMHNSNVIKLSRNFGKESAIAAALTFCDADAAIIIDADLQHPPSLIPALISEWEKGSDIVDAVKREREKRRIFSSIISISFNKIMTVLTDIDLADASDYKLLDSKAIRMLKRMNEKNRFFRGLTDWIGFKHSKVEFDVKRRKHGKSKWTPFKLFQLSLDAITSYTSKPLQIVTILGLCTLLFSFFLALQTLYNKIFGYAVTGFTTVILIILFFSSIIMICMGVLGLYLSKIFKEVKNRPTFIIDQNKSSQAPNEKSIE